MGPGPRLRGVECRRADARRHRERPTAAPAATPGRETALALPGQEAASGDGTTAAQRKAATKRPLPRLSSKPGRESPNFPGNRHLARVSIVFATRGGYKRVGRWRRGDDEYRRVRLARHA